MSLVSAKDHLDTPPLLPANPVMAAENMIARNMYFHHCYNKPHLYSTLFFLHNHPLNIRLHPRKNRRTNRHIQGYHLHKPVSE